MNKTLILAATVLTLAASSRAVEGSAAKAATIKVADSRNTYDPRVLTAKPGETVKLTFVNGSTAADGLHNWVLVKPGKDRQVALDGLAAGQDADYVPDTPDVLAHTKLLAQGKSQTIVFKAPKEPGTYPFLCTYPGHQRTMRGKLIVK